MKKPKAGTIVTFFLCAAMTVTHQLYFIEHYLESGVSEGNIESCSIDYAFLTGKKILAIDLKIDSTDYHYRTLEKYRKSIEDSCTNNEKIKFRYVIRKAKLLPEKHTIQAIIDGRS